MCILYIAYINHNIYNIKSKKDVKHIKNPHDFIAKEDHTMELSNLSKVKETAKTLVKRELIPTTLSPMVVAHPFTTTGLIVLEKPKMRCVNIMHNPDELKKWQSNLSIKITFAKSVFEIVDLVAEPFKAEFVKMISAWLTEDEKDRLSKEVWDITGTEEVRILAKAV